MNLCQPATLADLEPVKSIVSDNGETGIVVFVVAQLAHHKLNRTRTVVGNGDGARKFIIAKGKLGIAYLKSTHNLSAVARGLKQ